MSEDPTRPPCTDYNVAGSRPPQDPITKKRNGEVGYFTTCQNGDCIGSRDYSKSYCDTGYAEIGLCGGSSVGNARTSCASFCPGLGVSSCNVCDSQRRVCRRLLRDYTTEVKGTTHSECCRKDRSGAQQLDCPPGYFLGSPACIQDNENGLYFRCVTDPDSNVLGVGCHTLALASNSLIRYDYIDRLNQVCPYGDNIKHPACISAMEEFPSDTAVLKQHLLNFCKDKENNPEYRDVCACFYRDSFYEDILKQIQERFVIPLELLDGGRKCYYPPCAAAAIQYDPPANVCKAVNLVNCIQTITVNSSGQIDRLVINQDIQGCGSIRPISEDCPTPCTRPEVCLDGRCQDPDRCTSNAECGKDEAGNPRKCNAGVCEDIPKTSTLTKVGYAFAIIAGLVFVVLLIKWLAGRRGKAPANSTPSVTIQS